MRQSIEPVAERSVRIRSEGPPRSRSQQTIAQRAVVEGFGYWSGKDIRVEFRPAEPDTGIVFVRTDLDQPVRIPASVACRIETPLRTTLSAGGTTVEMVEHLLAALSGLGIDNCEVHVNECEMPGCDGSSLAFVTALQEAGTIDQHVDREQLVVQEVTRVGDENNWIEARPAKRGEFSLRYRLDYPNAPAIGRQTLEIDITPELFCRELAPSRTFMLQAEAQWLLAQGKGTRVSTSDVLIFDEEGPVDNELRFEDECARHKMLDFVGDLSMTGCHIVGRFIAHCSGHRLNAELARVLLQESQVSTPALRSA